MARRKKHEDHVNHEAWAIPYGDLLTLLLAFFVVMYAISSVNEGKYRVMSQSLSEAFGGPPQSKQPVNFGTKGAGDSDDSTFKPFKVMEDMANAAKDGKDAAAGDKMITGTDEARQDQAKAMLGKYADSIKRMSDEIRKALGSLIDRGLVHVTQKPDAVEVELGTDILFPSGSASLVGPAREPLSAVAEIVQNYPNALRIEGHTDDQPIATAVFPSNWELSAARAATVVHLFANMGVSEARMSVAGFGAQRPVADNITLEGRNRNRRVVIVIGAKPPEVSPLAAAQAEQSETQASAGVADNAVSDLETPTTESATAVISSVAATSGP